MPTVFSSVDTEKCLRSILSSKGFTLSPERVNGETGVDIIAVREQETFHIEVIGFKSSPPARSKDFYESFFRAISRLKDGANCCVIALPKRFERGLPARARQYGLAWERIGTNFPELQIWLVDTECRAYEPTSWNQWLSN